MFDIERFAFAPSEFISSRYSVPHKPNSTARFSLPRSSCHCVKAHRLGLTSRSDWTIRQTYSHLPTRSTRYRIPWWSDELVIRTLLWLERYPAPVAVSMMPAPLTRYEGIYSACVVAYPTGQLRACLQNTFIGVAKTQPCPTTCRTHSCAAHPPSACCCSRLLYTHLHNRRRVNLGRRVGGWAHQVRRGIRLLPIPHRIFPKTQLM